MKQLSLFEPISSGDRETYQYIEGDIPVDLPENTFISLDRKPPLKIYSLGFQPAKSIPEIPRWFLQKYGTKNCTILEPFAGSGTTILETLRYGASVYWLDYNPHSRLICQVKTTQFNLAEVQEVSLNILKNAGDRKTAPETVQFSNRDFWFQQPVQEGLEILKESIHLAAKTIQPLLWLVFAATVRKTSDMNDGMILAAKRSHVKDIPQRSREDTFKYFKFYLDKTLEAIGEWQYLLNYPLERAKQLSCKDAKKISGNFPIDAIITSPPYINAIDYIWACKFELHWLDLVKTNKERLDLYSCEIGTERIVKQEYQALGHTGYIPLDRLIEEIYTGQKYKASKGQNQLRARVVYKYFIEMKEHFQSCFTHLNSGGYYCFAIGHVSKICGVEIPVADLLTDLALEIGFKKEFSFHLLLKNRRLNLPRNVDWAGTIKYDTVVVLSKGEQ
ncbi:MULTISPECIES: hypothetical protein [Spirulina sp. CCY15215]|uniref:hypothetical protein n=1 Tax=Spirulina sp. CCY15215 TaxID=2767591 RepID=UPI0019518315|nr:hypothetical protein [Spirulina major]